MILVADSGSTKTNWACIDKTQSIHFNTIGMNPYFVTEEQVKSEIQDNFPKTVSPSEITALYFYGSGCGREESQMIIKNMLQSIFPKAKITVDSDLVGAAIACYGREKGIVAILGTGMNIGYWDGEKLETPMPSLGYIFGDAGSGAVLGRKLIQSVFEKRFSQALVDKFQQKYHLQLPELLDKVYKQPRPNAYLASFVPFLTENLDNGEIQKMLHDAYKEFANVYAKPIAQMYSVTKISFVGSISVVFQNILRDELAQIGVENTFVLASPLQKIEKFMENYLFDFQ